MTLQKLITYSTFVILTLFVRPGISQEDPLLSQIEQITNGTFDQDELEQLRDQAIAQNNRKAIIESTQAILQKQLKTSQFDEFDEHTKWIENLELWQSFPELRVVTKGAVANKVYRNGDVEKAIQLQVEVIKLAEQFELKSHLSHVYTRQGVYYRNNGDLDKAEEHYNQAIIFAKQQDNMVQVARITMNIGVINESTGKLNKALGLYKTALPIIEKSGNRTLLADCLFNITVVYIRLSDSKQALKFALKVLELDKEAGDVNNLIYSHSKVADIYFLLGDFDKALVNVDEAIALSQRSENKQQLSISLIRKAKVYDKQGKKEQALEYANQSANISLELGNVINKNNILPSLAELYISIGAYQKAIDILSQLDGEEISSLYAIKKYELLAQAEYNLSNYQPAYLHLTKALNARISLNKSKMEAYRDEMDVEIAKFSEQLKVKDLELKAKEQQNDIEVMQYRQYFFFSLSLIVLLLLSVLVYVQIKKKQLAQAETRMKEVAIENKNQMLSDICHELRTPFSVLRLQIEALQYGLEPDPDAAHKRLTDKIEQLNHLVSDIDQLSHADSMVLTLNKTKVDINQFLQRVVDDSRILVDKSGLTLKLDISVREGAEAKLDVNRILQVLNNLFSNAIRYTSVPGHLRLKARADSKTLFLQLDDTAPGVSKDDLELLFNRLYRVEKSRSRATGGLGLGLSICKSLVELHEGTIVAKQGKSGGLCVQLLLPL
jgi:signal transduction histidine kinase/Tfp pilus assembly protein PilF